jgi:hypothetical protein
VLYLTESFARSTSRDDEKGKDHENRSNENQFHCCAASVVTGCNSLLVFPHRFSSVKNVSMDSCADRLTFIGKKGTILGRRSVTVATTVLPDFFTTQEPFDVEPRPVSVRAMARSPALVDDPNRAATAAPSFAAALATFAP